MLFTQLFESDFDKSKQDIAEGEIERQHGDLKPWAYWNSPERVAQKLYKIHGGAPIGKSDVVALWKQDGPDRMTKFTLKPDVAAILSTYEAMTTPGGLLEGEVYDLEKEYGYEKPRNQPRRSSSGGQTPGVNPDDEDYFREIFRKQRLAKQKAEQDKQQGVAEASKKKDDAEPEIRDVGLQRAITRAKADFPTAGSGIEALSKDFMRSQEQDQKSLDQIRNIDQQQDSMLKQMDQIDQQQNDELQGLEAQNSTLAKRLQQLQSVNSQLEKKLAAMSGRKPKEKDKTPTDTVSTSGTSVAAEPTSAQDTTTTTAGPTTAEPTTAEPTTSKAIGQVAKSLSGPNTSPAMDRIAKELQPRQKELGFDEPVTLKPKKYDTSQATDVVGRDIAKNVKQNIQQYSSRLTGNNPTGSDTDALRNLAAQQEMPVENKEPEAKYNNKYQDMVARVGQKAREQEKKKPVDIADLARRLAAIDASRKDE